MGQSRISKIEMAYMADLKLPSHVARFVPQIAPVDPTLRIKRALDGPRPSPFQPRITSPTDAKQEKIPETLQQLARKLSQPRMMEAMESEAAMQLAQTMPRLQEEKINSDSVLESYAMETEKHKVSSKIKHELGESN